MLINKEKVWRYMNIADGTFIFCFILGVLFFRDHALNIAVGWMVAFLCSGLGLRRYCRGKGMMRYGTINNVDSEDHDAVMSSYYSHRWTMVICTIGVVFFTIYQLWQSII